MARPLFDRVPPLDGRRREERAPPALAIVGRDNRSRRFLRIERKKWRDHYSIGCRSMVVVAKNARLPRWR
jgi:hypothetical protein